MLAWLGDSRVRAWQGRDERTDELGLTWQSADHWTSRDNVDQSQPGLIALPLFSGHRPWIDRVVTYSDGLSDLDGLPVAPDNTQLQDLIDHTTARPTSDDVTFLEVVVSHTPA